MTGCPGAGSRKIATHKARPMTNAGYQNTAMKYTALFRRLIARRTIARAALFIFVVSILYGQSAILDILAIAFLVAAIGVSLFSIRWRSLFLAPVQEASGHLFRCSRFHEAVDRSASCQRPRAGVRRRAPRQT